MRLSVYSFNSPHQVCERERVVLRAPESGIDVFCMCFDRWERSRHLLEEAVNYKRWHRQSLSPMSCVIYRK